MTEYLIINQHGRRIVAGWGDENSLIGALNFYPIFVPLFGYKVSGVSVQDMPLRLPFLASET